MCFTLTVHQYTPVPLICICQHRATALGVNQNHVYTFFPFISLTHAHAHRVEHVHSNKKVNTTIAPVQFKRKGEWRNLRYVHSFIWKTSGYWSNRAKTNKKIVLFRSKTILKISCILWALSIVILRCGFNSWKLPIGRDSRGK